VNRWQYLVGLVVFLVGGDLRWRSGHSGFWWSSLSGALLALGLYLITECVFVDRTNKERAEGRLRPGVRKDHR
jgi:hypothetical protein